VKQTIETDTSSFDWPRSRQPGFRRRGKAESGSRRDRHTLPHQCRKHWAIGDCREARHRRERRTRLLQLRKTSQAASAT
jgi:hypothetical protein